MTTGRHSKGQQAAYTVTSSDTGYVIRQGGLVVKSYRLNAICYQLSARGRRTLAAEFARYDIANAGMMIH